MKKITVSTYKKDTYYPRIVKATLHILKESDEISPVAILLQMGNLMPKDYESWSRGQVPYLERVFQGNLSKANRILRIIRFHAHDLNMVPYQHSYRQIGTNRPLRFSKTGDEGVETAYSRHFRWNQSQEKKKDLLEA